MKVVFFYGLFMDEAMLKEQGLNPRNCQLACLRGYGLRIGNKATLELSEHEICYGTVMQLSNSELDQLYASAGVVDYMPQSIQVTALSGELIDAVTYILPMEMLSGHNSSYALALVAVAQKLNMPEDYINEIATWC